jgi:hypothetical protein
MRGVFQDGAAGGITSLDLPARCHGGLSQAHRPDVEVEVLGGSKRGSRCRVGYDEQAERVNAGLPERRRGRGYRDEAMGGGQDEDVAAGRKAAKVSSVTPMAPSSTWLIRRGRPVARAREEQHPPRAAARQLS